MSRFSQRAIRFCIFLIASLLVFGASQASATADGLTPAGAVRQAWQRATAGGHGSYRFTSDIEQTLAPRARADNIGHSDQRLDMRAEGSLRLPDHALLQLTFEGSPNTPPVGILQDGQRAFVQAGDALKPVENPLAATAPSGDQLAFLAAATEVRQLEQTPATGTAMRHYAFRIDGKAFAAYVSDRLQNQMAAEMPAGVNLSPPPLLERMTGTGELWVDGAGLPRRLVVDLSIPAASDQYDAKSRITTDYRDFGSVDTLPHAVPDGKDGWRLSSTSESGAAGALGQSQGETGEGKSASSTTDKGQDRSETNQVELRQNLSTALIAIAAAFTAASTAALRAAAAPMALLIPLLALAALLVLITRRRRQAYHAAVILTCMMVVAGPLFNARQSVSFFAKVAKAAEAPTLADVLAGAGAGAGASTSAAKARRQHAAHPQDGSASQQTLSLEMSSPDNAPVHRSAARLAQPGQPERTESARQSQPGQPATSVTARIAQQAQPAGGVSTCGDGSQTHDTDADGLTDFQEGCIGTDPYRPDTDEDLIPDKVELDGIAYGGTTWHADPLKGDTNADGLSDLAEWPGPVGQAPAMDVDGNGTVTSAEAWDPDGDGVPSPWDADNDDDAVPDRLDLSAFSRTGSVADYSVSTLGTGFGGYEYIELQVRPENADHLRYTTSALDWPYDELGQITDLDNSKDDLSLRPMLEVVTNIEPERELARNYGVSTIYHPENAADPYTMYVPVLPVSDGGQIVAFYGKVAYPPAQIDAIRWRAKLVWMVQSNVERLVGSNFKTEVQPIQTYAEAQIRVTGLQVTKSSGFESAVFGTPTAPGDDRQLFNLLFGLSSTFLTHQTPDLQEVKSRFDGALTPAEEKWGVDIAVKSSWQAYAHRDAGLADTSGRRLNTFLNQNYNPAADTPSALVAFQEDVGAYSLDDAGAFDAPATSVSLAEIDVFRQRGVQLNMYDFDGTAWRTLDLAEMLDEVAGRAADLSTVMPALQATYPDLTPANVIGVLATLYTVWNTGHVRVIGAPETSLVDASASDSEVFAHFDRPGGFSLPEYVIDVAELAQPEGGLRFGNSNIQSYSFIRQQSERGETGFDFAGISIYQIGTKNSTFLGFDLDGFNGDTLAILKAESKAFLALRTAGQALAAASKLGTGLKSLITMQKLSSRTFGAIGLVITVGMVWVQFGMLTDFSDPIALGNAIAYSVVATIFWIVLFAISLFPIGAIFIAIFLLIDFIVLLATSGKVSISETIITSIAGFFFESHILVELEAAEFQGFNSRISSPTGGLTAGGELSLSAVFDGLLRKTSDGNSSDLRQASVEGVYVPSAVGVQASAEDGDFICYDSGEPYQKRCRNIVQARYSFAQAVRNAHIELDTFVKTALPYEECGLNVAGASVICNPKTLRKNLPEDREPIKIDLDVLPATLDGLWAGDIQLGLAYAHTFNPDRDGDGRADTLERSAVDCATPATQGCTRSDAWDTDGDGLSDGYEVDNQARHGFSASKADTDGDGLADGMEYRLGTEADNPDTDADGLNDGAEVWEPGEILFVPGTTPDSTPGVGGWLMRVPGGAQVPVFSDPRRDDVDGDGLLDATERLNGTSPFAPNLAPQLILTVQPAASDSAGRDGSYVLPGTPVSVQLSVYSSGPLPIDGVLDLCLPAFLANPSGGAMTGAQSPPAVQTLGCGGDSAAHHYTWSLTGAASLALGSVVSTTLSATAGPGFTSSISGTVAAQLPYSDGKDKDGDAVPDAKTLLQRVTVAVDADQPTAGFTAPENGAFLGGSHSTYVIGGSAADVASWVDQVEVSTNGGGSWAPAEGISPWAFQWTLPADGTYALKARARDFAGNVTNPPAGVSVTVDRTVPQVAITSPANGAFVTDASGNGATIVVSGTATDNLSGVLRVQAAVDERPWREVALNGGSWHLDWELPPGDAAQGKHTVRVRGVDRAQNESTTQSIQIVVDVVPPADALTSTRFMDDPPSVTGAGPVALRGLANDAGNSPLPSRPEELKGQLDSLADATVWLSPDAIGDDDGGVSVTWIGDYNGDRLADLAVGLPAVGSGDGKVAVVFGRPGGWPVPDAVALVGDAAASYVGATGSGAAIGTHVRAAGDVNGDGRDDFLVGDPSHKRVFVIFGQAAPVDVGAELAGPNGGHWTVLEAIGLAPVPPPADPLGTYLDGAGDVNGDSLDDFLVGSSNRSYLVLGQPAGSWLDRLDVKVLAATSVSAAAGGSRVLGVGDMDGDQKGEFVLTDPTNSFGAGAGVYLFRGSAGLAAQGVVTGAPLNPPTDKAAFFAGSATSIAALGDVNGDHRADFIFAATGGPKLVFGAAGGAGQCCLTLNTYNPAATGFLASPGNVDADSAGLNDILVGAADGSAYLLLGSATLTAGGVQPAIAARIASVAGAASAPYAAGADANADGSSDLLVVPAAGSTAVLTMAMLDFGNRPSVSPAALPVAAGGDGAGAGQSSAIGSSVRPTRLNGGLDLPLVHSSDAVRTLATLQSVDAYVDDDWVGTANGADPDGAGPATSFGTNAFATIDAAVAAASANDTISVLPGVYSGLEVDGATDADGLTIEGVDADAVFVEGRSFGGTTAAAYLHGGVTGVTLSGMTLRNAQRCAWLDHAGVGGYDSPLAGQGNAALKTRLSRVLMVGCDFGVHMDRASALALADSTIATDTTGDRHLRVDPTTPDSALDPSWSAAPSDVTAGLGAGGGIAASTSRVRAVRGGDTRDFYGYDPTSGAAGTWSTLASTPLDVASGSTLAAHLDDVFVLGRQDRFRNIEGGTGGPFPKIIKVVVSGTNVFVGGSFSNLSGSGTVFNSVARFDTVTRTWHSLAQGVRGGGGGIAVVEALAVDGSGNVYVGGPQDSLTEAVQSGGTVVPVNSIAKWTASTNTWSALGAGIEVSGACGGTLFNADVKTIAASGSSVFVGGVFGCAGGAIANSIAKWDGSSWSTPGGATLTGGLTRTAGSNTFAGEVYDILPQSSTTFYVTGRFDNAPTDNLALYNGTSFVAVGPSTAPLDVQGSAIAKVGSDLFVSDVNFGGGNSGKIRRLRSNAWTDITPSGLGATVRGSVLAIGTTLYVVGNPWLTSGVIGVYNTSSETWSLLMDSTALIGGAVNGLNSILGFGIQGTEGFISGDFSTVQQPDGTSLGVNRLASIQNEPRLVRYTNGTSAWTARTNPPVYPADGSAMVSDGADALYTAFGGSTTSFYRHNLAANTWTAMANVPVAVTTGAAMTWAGGQLYLLRGDVNLTDGVAGFYRFTPNGGTGTWLQRADLPFDVAVGADVEWDGGDFIYAVQGGNNRAFARYNLTSNAWTLLGDTNGGTPVGSAKATLGNVNSGGGLARIGTTLYAARGNGTAFDKFGPVAVRPEKLTLTNVAFVAPETAATATWLNTDLLDPVLGEPDDFLVGGGGNAWLPGPSSVWTPAAASAPVTMSFVTYSAARFLDPARNLFRVRTGSVLAAGYHDAVADAHVYTSQAACDRCALPLVDPNHLTWGVDALSGIQAAIDTGALRVLVHAGTYHEAVHLVSGVDVLGSGADLVVLNPPLAGTAGLRSLVQAEGVAGARLARMTVAGATSVDGVRMEQGAQDASLRRMILRDNAVGLRVDGATTDVEVANLTLNHNTSGMLFRACAPVDVRNSVFAGHKSAGTGVALDFQSCAASVRHTYNDFWDNDRDFVVNGAAVQQPQSGEIFLDPLFTDPSVSDFRPEGGSPLVDAGNPTDPVPPGVGGRIDMGFVESFQAAFFADNDYCEFCENDGLEWHVDAFALIADALAAASSEITALGCGPLSAGGSICATQWTVGVGPGTYAEHVTVPSHVDLAGSGPDATVIDGTGSGSPVRVTGAISVAVKGFTIRGSGASPAAGVRVDGASNGVSVVRNLIRNNGDGVRFESQSTGQVSFNTLVDNAGSGLLADGAGTWCRARNNILATTPNGFRTVNQGQIYTDYNLVRATGMDFRDDAGTGLAAADGDLTGQAPGFAGGGSFHLTPTSPAVDAAEPSAPVPAGGGARADLGYTELIAPPLALLFGKEGVSAATGNSGIASVAVGVRFLADPSLPVTHTLSIPQTFAPATLEMPGDTASYWTRSVTPTNGNGLYRIYSRATDGAGNMVDDAAEQFRGSFLLDGTAPVVTWLAPANGTTTTAPLELRAGVSDYVAGKFNVAETYFEVQGTVYPAEWAPAPWDPNSGAPRVFRAWANLPAGSYASADVEAVAVDNAGNEGRTSLVFVADATQAVATQRTAAAESHASQTNQATAPILPSSPNAFLTITGPGPVDAVRPTVAVTQPLNGAHVGGIATFSGTAADTGGSGLAGVEVSLDGGQTWSPAVLSGGNWSLAWATPSYRQFESYPVRVRARDRAGNVSLPPVALVVTVDNVPPVGVAPVTFSITEGMHVDTFTNLTIGWQPAVDGDGSADVLLTVDQAPETVPSGVTTGQSQVVALNALGAWYVHIAGVDTAGNMRIRHFGPWFVGTVGEAGVACASRRQTIVLDGVLGATSAEWRDDTELLQTDERSGVPQSLYTTWDGVNAWLGWQGSSWQIDGTLFAYFDTAAGGTVQALAATPGGTVLDLPDLPFAADWAVAVDGPQAGGLWRFDGAAWVADNPGAAEFGFAQGDQGGTEIRLPWGAADVTGTVRMMAFAVNDAGAVTSAFPLGNANAPAGGAWSAFYAWTGRCTVASPNGSVQRTRLATLVLDSTASPLAPLGPDSTVDHILTVENPEADALTGATLVITTPSTSVLGYQTLLSGGTCSFGSCPAGGASWTVTLPSVPAGGSAEVRVRGRLATPLSGVDAVTTHAQLQFSGPKSGEAVLAATLTHAVDSEAPSVAAIAPDAVIGTTGGILYGESADAPGIGVETVEVKVGAGPWMGVTGTTRWSVPVTPAVGATTVQIQMRATDFYGQTSVQTQQVTVDGVLPVITGFVLPPVVGGDTAQLGGNASDPFPAGGVVKDVEVQIDGALGPWLPAIVIDAGGGQYGWNFAWHLPTEYGTTHQVRARAVDAAGNVGNPTAWQTTLLKGETSTVLNVLTPNPATLNGPITVTATVASLRPSASVTPTGLVTVTDGTAGCTFSLPATGCSYAPVTAGVKTLTVTYGGDAHFNGSQADHDLTVNKAATALSLASTPNPAERGAQVTLTATIQEIPNGPANPSGPVQFFDGPTVIATGTLGATGVATASVSFGLVGNHSLTAQYGGDANFTGSAATAVTQTISKTPTAVTLSTAPNPSIFGQWVTMTIQVQSTGVLTAPPAGDITIRDGSTVLLTDRLNGVGTAWILVNTLVVGSHNLTVDYLGATDFLASTSNTISQTVNKASCAVTLSSSPNPSVFGQSAAMTATVTALSPSFGAATGTVTFTDAAATLGSNALNAGGQASLSTSALAAGSHPLAAAYGGSANFNTCTSPSTNHTVNPGNTTTTVASSPNPANIGASVTFTATVAVAAPAVGMPGGTVQFKDGAAVIGTGTLSGGQASFSTTTLVAGSHAITAAYLGNGSFNPSTSSVLNQTINPPTPVDLAVIHTDTPDPVRAGDQVTYRITVTNNSSLATSVTLTDTLASQTTFASQTPAAGWTCTTPAGKVVCTTPSLAGGAQAVFIVVANVPSTLAANTQLVNVANVVGAAADSNMANNTSTATTMVYRARLLSEPGEGEVGAGPEEGVLLDGSRDVDVLPPTWGRLYLPLAVWTVED